MAKQRLRVVYDGPGIDTELDEAIEKALAPLGYKRWASGYDLVDDERDLAFEREPVYHGNVKSDSQDSYRAGVWGSGQCPTG